MYLISSLYISSKNSNSKNIIAKTIFNKFYIVDSFRVVILLNNNIITPEDIDLLISC